MIAVQVNNNPVRPYPGGGQNPMMQMMMQLMMKMMQMMMSQFQGGGQQQHYGQNPYGAQGGYGQQNPSPFNYFGGGAGGGYYA